MGRKKQPGDDDIKEDWVKKEIKLRLDCFPRMHHFMPPAGMYGRSGIHDHLITQESLSWTIEAKHGTKTPTDNQIKFANAIRDAGGLSLKVSEFNLDDVIKVAVYVQVFKRLPHFLCHDFNQWA